MKKVMDLIKNDFGATAVEYGLMVASIAGVIIVIVLATGGKINTMFTILNNVWP